MVWQLLQEAKNRYVRFSVDIVAEGFYRKNFGANNPYVSSPESFANQDYLIPSDGVKALIEKIGSRQEYQLFKKQIN